VTVFWFTLQLTVTNVKKDQNWFVVIKKQSNYSLTSRSIFDPSARIYEMFLCNLTAKNPLNLVVSRRILMVHEMNTKRIKKQFISNYTIA
jgi:hypothetical protein